MYNATVIGCYYLEGYSGASAVYSDSNVETKVSATFNSVLLNTPNYTVSYYLKQDMLTVGRLFWRWYNESWWSNVKAVTTPLSFCQFLLHKLATANSKASTDLEMFFPPQPLGICAESTDVDSNTEACLWIYEEIGIMYFIDPQATWTSELSVFKTRNQLANSTYPWLNTGVYVWVVGQ